MTQTLPVTERSAGYYELRFSQEIQRINDTLALVLSGSEPDGLWSAMRYGTLNGGKRIRGVLCLECCRACGGDSEIALPTAAAIELVHAQSLIHDDLPCMDDDDLRRGQPTVHKAYDESTAVLTGDALLALSFGVITRHTPSPPVSAQALLSIIQDLSDVSSVQGLVNGQYVDIQYEGKAFTQEILEYIHTYKTGALFSFSTRSGARLAGADDDTVETFSKFGQTLGLAFQIVDDLLDIEASSEQLGKTPGKDERQQKATYPSLMGLAKAREAAEQLIAEAIALLDGLQLPQERVEGLRSLSQFIGERIC